MNPSLTLFFAALVASQSPGTEPLVLTEDQAVAIARENSPELPSLPPGGPTVPLWVPLEYFPKLSLSAGQEERYSVGGPDSREIRWGVTCQQLLFDAGRGSRIRDLARWEAVLENQRYEAGTQDVLASVRSLYRRIQVLETQWESLGAVVLLAEKYAALAEARRGLGLAREIDVLETESQLTVLRLDRNQAALTRNDALFRLKNLLGLDPTVPLILEGTFDFGYLGVDLPVDDRWATRVLGTDLTLKSADLDRRKAAAERLDADLWFFPEVTLDAGWTVSGRSYPLQTPAWEARLTFRFPWDNFPVVQSTGLGVTPGQSWSPSTSTSIGILPGFVPGASGKGAGQDNLVRKIRGELQASFAKIVAEYRLLVERTGYQRKNLGLADRKNKILGKQTELGESTWLESLEAETQWSKDRVSLGEAVVRIRDLEALLERWLRIPPGTLGAFASGQAAL